jgi:hypothetical protein
VKIYSIVGIINGGVGDDLDVSIVVEDISTYPATIPITPILVRIMVVLSDESQSTSVLLLCRGCDFFNIGIDAAGCLVKGKDRRTESPNTQER